MSVESCPAMYSVLRQWYTLSAMQKLRPPSRLRDRFAGMFLGAGATIVMTYLALLALEMILPLFNVKALSIVSTRRIGIGYVFMFLIGGGWLAALILSFRYIYYIPGGTVYSRALRVFGAIFAAGIPVHAILVTRISAGIRWAAVMMLVGIAAISVAAFWGARRFDRLRSKGRRMSKRNVLDSYGTEE